MCSRCSGGELRRRRDLDELLVAALDRAVALEEVDRLAGASASTCTSMWRGFDDALLEEDLGAAEGLRRLGDDAVPGNAQLLGESQRRMPRPPPPEVALSITG